MDKVVKDQSTEQRILGVARQVFFKKGYAGARMQDIADEANINKALLHYYFRSKDKLFEMIFLEATSQFLPKVQFIIGSDKPLFEKIEQFVHEYLEVLANHPFIPMFILNEFHKNPEAIFEKIFSGNRRPPVKKFAAQIAEEVKKGAIRPTDPMQLLINIISLCIFPFVARPLFQMVAGLSDGQYKKIMEQRKTEVVRFVINAIKP